MNMPAGKGAISPALYGQGSVAMDTSPPAEGITSFSPQLDRIGQFPHQTSAVMVSCYLTGKFNGLYILKSVI